MQKIGQVKCLMNTSATKIKDARDVALDCLIQIHTKGRSLAELQTHLNEHQHAALIREMVFGVCRWFYYFDTVVREQLKKPLRKKDHDILLIIYLGLYQLQFMNTSDHAAVNETVNLVFKVRKKWAKGLVNALLRAFSKKQIKTEEIEEMSSFPIWMTERFTDDWPESTADIAHFSNQKASIALRINNKKSTVKDYLNLLTESDIAYETDNALPYYVRLKHTQNVMQLPSFDKGAVYVQDGSAQMASQLLNVQDNMRVLDACAAPGGKSTHLAELTNNADIIAVEKEQKRIQRLEDNIKRLGHEITIVCGDAAEPKSWFKGDLFDRILIDAPCSASGIIRRHPDIKLLRRAEDIEQLVKLQAKILAALWPLLKVGGELLYCTCSIFKQENELQVATFIEQHDDCSEIKIEPFSWGQQRPIGLQVLPSAYGHDGFYYAKLTKNKN